MSSTFVTIPGNTFKTLNEIGISFDAINHNNIVTNMRNTFKDNNKKVEVRWLESEANFYLKQWRKRYQQWEVEFEDTLHPLCWTHSHLFQRCDDWYLTARAFLDIDTAYLSSKDFRKFKHESERDDELQEDESLDPFFNQKEQKLYDQDEDEDYELENEYNSTFDTITFDPSLEMNEEFMALLRSNNLTLRNGRLEKENLNEKSKQTPDSNKQSSSKKISPAAGEAPGDMSATDLSITNHSGVSPNTAMISAGIGIGVGSVDGTPNGTKSSNKNLRNKIAKPRSRPATTRRQMYICEYPGCSYQSDRNFNFLRHKRTHGKQKNEDVGGKRSQSPLQPQQHAFVTTASNDSSFGIIQSKAAAADYSQHNGGLHTAVNNMDSSSASLLSNELNIDLAVPVPPPPPICDSVNLNISENGHSYLLADPDMSSYLQHHQGIIMKDLNHLEHLLTENHFSSLTLDQTYLS